MSGPVNVNFRKIISTNFQLSLTRMMTKRITTSNDQALFAEVEVVLESSFNRALPSIRCLTDVGNCGESDKSAFAHSWRLLPDVDPLWCKFCRADTTEANREESPGTHKTVSICCSVKT